MKLPIENVKKYLHYVFDNKSFDPHSVNGMISERAFAAAREIRGANRQPTLFIQGITKRSGTVYVGQLISLHRQICAYPNKIWEAPFLPRTGEVIELQKHFFEDYDKNVGRLGDHDFLPVFGASFINYMYTGIQENYRLLLKMPGVQYLNYFYHVFPYEHLLLLLRDGRDVVSSTIKTWPQIGFINACRRWDLSAKMVIACRNLFSGKDGFWIARYEDAVRSPEEFLLEACRHFNLDPEGVAGESINDIALIGSSTNRKHAIENQGIDWAEKPKGFNPIGRWQTWSPRHKFIFKMIAGKSLLSLGYSENMDW